MVYVDKFSLILSGRTTVKTTSVELNCSGNVVLRIIFAGADVIYLNVIRTKQLQWNIILMNSCSMWFSTELIAEFHLYDVFCVLACIGGVCVLILGLVYLY